VENVHGSRDDVSRKNLGFSTVHRPYYCLGVFNKIEGATTGEVSSGP